MNIPRRWIENRKEGAGSDGRNGGRAEAYHSYDHTMRDAIHMGNRLIMMHEGKCHL